MARAAMRAAGGLALFAAGSLVVVWQFGHLAAHMYRVPSSSMEPTLHCARPWSGCEGKVGDRVIVPRFAPFWTPSRGDIVVFDTPPEARLKCGAGGTFLKRLIGLPGETVSERHGTISIDGRPLREPYVKPGHRDTMSGTWHVPAGGYFVLGDNRAQSCDSRYWGSVPRNNLIGPVVLSWTPLGRSGPL